MSDTIVRGYPSGVADYAGRITDVDAHEWLHPDRWVEEFGELTRPFAEAETLALAGYKDPKHGYFRNVNTEATTTLTPEAVWKTKGPHAPGAGDMAARLDVMDYTGVAKQLVFPGNVAINAAFMFGQVEDLSFFPQITGDRRAYAKKCLDAQNNWVIRQTKISDRLRMVAALVADTPAELLNEAKRLIDAGVRAFWLPSSILPGGCSPAHNDLDPVWELCASTQTVLTLHVGNETEFFKTLEWKNAEAFKGWRMGGEVSLDPWTLANMNVPSQNFTATMVVGGVFERHPELRLGAIELGANWIGPLAELLDMWSENTQTSKWSERLPLKPSAYINRNVRVSGFPWEPIDKYIERYGLEDVYCYASDFPHVEGGTDPMGFWSARFDRLGPDIKEKFFVKNGEWLLP